MGLSLGDDEDTQLHILLSKPFQAYRLYLTYSDKSPTDFATGHSVSCSICYSLTEVLIKEPAENCVLNAIAHSLYTTISEISVVARKLELLN